MNVPRTKIVIIGAGKIAYSLSAAIINAGFEIVSIISKNKTSAKNLAKKFSVPGYSDDYNKTPPDANLFLFTVPDSEIIPAANRIAKINLIFKTSLFVHFSGVETIKAFESIRQKDGNIGSIHIMQTFPSKEIISIKKCYAAVEAPEKKTEKILFGFAKKLNLHPFKINSDSKIMYHLAGVFASNFMAGNFFTAEKLFNRSTKDGRFYKVIKALSETTLGNILNNGASKSLSGPVQRGDVKTIKYHLQSFDKLNLSKKRDDIFLMKKNYIIQSLSLLELVKLREGKLNRKHSAIKKILLSELEKTKITRL